MRKENTMRKIHRIYCMIAIYKKKKQKKRWSVLFFNGVNVTATTFNRRRKNKIKFNFVMELLKYYVFRFS